MDIFNIIGPIMIGPSSSHTAGACKIGNIASLLLAKPPVKAKITLYGSFAKTGAGHGTDKALIAGIMGYRYDDIRLKDSFEFAKRAGLEFDFEEKSKVGVHPNTANITLEGSDGICVNVVGISVGGGRVMIESVNDFDAGFDGENHTIIVVHTDKPGVIAYASKVLADAEINIAQMSSQRTKRGGIAALIIESDNPVGDESVNKIKEHDMVRKIFVVPKV